MDLVKIQDKHDLAKDQKSGAVLLIDNATHHKYLQEKEKARRQLNMESRIESLEENMNEIKSLLKQILEK